MNTGIHKIEDGKSNPQDMLKREQSPQKAEFTAADLLNIAMEAFGDGISRINFTTDPTLVWFDWRGKVWRLNQSLGVSIREKDAASGFAQTTATDIAGRLLRLAEEKMRR